MRYNIILLFLFYSLKSVSQESGYKIFWVDSVFNQMTLDDKIGQLFMVRAFSKADNADLLKIKVLIEKFRIGGICFFQGSPKKQAELTNYYQKISKIPLMISMDAEWGLGMRFPESTISFPRQLTLGAIQDNALIEEFGQSVATQLKGLGIHMNFGPVADINNNAKNPVINDRSFGEDVYNVASKSYHYAIGMQKAGILASAKHFPGHGDTDKDSHFNLPTIQHSRARLDEVELYPFRSLIDKKIASIMVAHLHIPALDNRINRPTSLSKSVITDLIRGQYGYEGLLITDALDMKGVTKSFYNGLAEAEAVMAGNDILLLSENVAAAVRQIKLYLQKGYITSLQLDESVKRILSAKYDCGLSNFNPIDILKVNEFLNDPFAVATKTKLIEAALTLVKDNRGLLPLDEVQPKKMATLSIGEMGRTKFQSRLSDFADFDHYNTPMLVNEGAKIALVANLKKYDKVVVSLHNLSKQSSKNFGISPNAISLLKQISLNSEVILTIFGSPYSLSFFDNIGTILLAYEDDTAFRDVAAQAIFGVTSITGRLPITASNNFYLGLGINKASIGRLGYSSPEHVGLSSEALKQIDNIASNLIDDRSAPGCQILVAKDGKIIMEKGYGKFTYEGAKAVNKETIYDLASMTKILATTLAVMKLHEDKKLNINAPIYVYLPEADTTNKAHFTVYDILAHVASLLPWIPFWEGTMVLEGKKSVLNRDLYSSILKDGYNTPVAKNIFIKNEYKDTIIQKILSSQLRTSDNYRYSDLGLYLIAKIIENVSSQKLNNYLDDQFYKPLGLRTMGYNPIFRMPIDEITPTENDNYWRNQEVRGTVHDMGAAMLGGVAGHAGLFSNAKDVAVIMQMLINNGSYGGRQYLKPETINTFLTRHPRSTRRGLGFDLKELDPLKNENVSNLASQMTFGHTGFTGTATYADPKYNLIYVFLSNRTYPSMRNNRLNSKDYRLKVQTAIYKSLLDQGV